MPGLELASWTTNMRKMLTAILSLALLSGCATSMVPREKAKAIPSDRLYETEFVYRGQPDNAEVVLIRDVGMVGSACLHRIWVDNVKVAALDVGEMISLGLTPGSHFIRLEMGVGMCADMQVSESFNLLPGDKRQYRVMIDSNFKLALVRMQ